MSILIAPLDWGLGHATRCIPLIHHFIRSGCKVVIATEGIQEKLLKTEFPSLDFVQLPGYDIRYTTGKRFFALKIFLQSPKVLLSIRREQKWLKAYLKENRVSAIISDNRYGLHHSKVPSIFITHQLFIKAPFTFVEHVLQRVNYLLIKKFAACWVPDEAGEKNLSGALSHPVVLPRLPVSYIGGLSRLKTSTANKKQYDLLIIISGPEPQRTLLERKMLTEVKDFQGKVLLIRGLPGRVDPLSSAGGLTIKNHLPAAEMSQVFNASEMIISRSGYTTIMDICKLKKKSILIPTPGQTEQEYLAQHLQKQGWCLTAHQEGFSLREMINKAEKFDFAFPEMDMNLYKITLDAFINKLS